MAIFTVTCAHDDACDELATLEVAYWVDLDHGWQEVTHTCTAHMPATMRRLNPARVDSVVEV